MEFLWNASKNEHLKAQRGLSFAMVREEINSGRLLAELPHRGRINQSIFIVLLDGYVCAVPFVRDGDVVFLKTIYPDRKLNALYGVKDGKRK